MKWAAKQFTAMRFPVYEVPVETDLCSLYPELGRMKEAHGFFDGGDRNIFIRYVLFGYDANCPVTELSNIEARKEAALTLAGFPIDSPLRKAICENRMPEVNDLIVAFLRFMNNRLFQMRMAALEAFHEYQRIIIDPIDRGLDDDKKMRAANLKTKLIEDCDLIHAKIERYNTELFGSGEEAETIEKKVARVSPETIGQVEF